MDEQGRTAGRSSLFTAGLSRRRFLGGLMGLGVLGTATTALTEPGKAHQGQGGQASREPFAPAPYPTHRTGAPTAALADLPPPLQLSDPMTFLTTYDSAPLTRLPDGRVQREYTVIALDREIEVAPDAFFPAWTYNDAVPGSTLRVIQGDRLRVNFYNGRQPSAHESLSPHSPALDGWRDSVRRTGGVPRL